MDGKSFKIKVLIFLMLALNISCSNKFTKYTIKAGNHSSTTLPVLLGKTSEISFYFTVNESWYYKKPEHPGWNKIRGFSQGEHQSNSSARLGYQCLDDTLLVVGAYCYVDGISPQENPAQKGIIDTVQAGNTYLCRILREDGKYKFYFGDKYWEGPAGKFIDWGYRLNPYIGGEFTLDHDWTTKIKDGK
jgi:hypothetical protein